MLLLKQVEACFFISLLRYQVIKRWEFLLSQDDAPG